MNLAPVVLFTYNRPYHTQKTLEALKESVLAEKTDLIVYLDGPQNNTNDIQANKQIQELVNNLTGFYSVKLIKKLTNSGLAQSIIGGVTEIIKIYGKIIVLEDDIIVGKYFLQYMNEALNKYEHNTDVWHITGWNEICCFNAKEDAFFYPLMDCWSWATWENRWKYFIKKPDKILNTYRERDIFRFNVDGLIPSKWNQIIGNANGRNDTWAIFWYEIILRNHGLCLAPCKSLVNNIGFDNSGIHSKKKDKKKIPYYENIDYIVNSYPTKLEINYDCYNQLKKAYKKKYRWERIREKIKKMLPKFLFVYISDRLYR